MKIFIAGIMQGSRTEKSIHGQDYRSRISKAILDRFPDVEIYDPYANHKNSLQYADETGKDTFLRHNRMCRSEIDLLIAFVPEASMGTAVEMWEAWKNGATILSISPMARNWVVRYLSTEVYPDLDSFLASIPNWSLSNDRIIVK